MKIMTIVLVPVNVLYVSHIMYVALFLECISTSKIYSIYLNNICGSYLACTLPRTLKL